MRIARKSVPVLAGRWRVWVSYTRADGAVTSTALELEGTRKQIEKKAKYACQSQFKNADIVLIKLLDSFNKGEQNGNVQRNDEGTEQSDHHEAHTEASCIDAAGGDAGEDEPDDSGCSRPEGS